MIILSRPLQFPYFILSVLSIFQDSRSLLCCLQHGPHVLCRICNAEQRQLWINSTRSEFLIASTCLQCPVCSQRAQGVTKVPFLLLLSPVAPERSVSFFPAVIKPHRKPQVCWTEHWGALPRGRVTSVTSQRSVSAFLELPIILLSFF